jgi:hypothetical protein
VRRTFASAAILLLSCCIAAAETMTPAQYSSKVGEVAQELDRASRAGARSDRLAQQALAKLPRHVEVRMPAGGAGTHVDNGDLLQALRDDVARGKRGTASAASVLRNLQATLRRQGPPAPADARKVLARVLHRVKPGRIAAWEMAAIRWVERALRYIESLLNRAGRYIGARVPSVHLPPGTSRFLLIALLIVIGVLILYLIARIVTSIGPRAGRPAAEEASPSAKTKPHTAWLADAEAALRVGDYRGGLRALHMAALMRLDEAGHIAYVDSRTDGRFVRALRETGRTETADALAALSVIFAAAWYGKAPAGPTEYLRAQAQWRQLEALAAP